MVEREGYRSCLRNGMGRMAMNGTEVTRSRKQTTQPYGVKERKERKVVAAAHETLLVGQ